MHLLPGTAFPTVKYCVYCYTSILMQTILFCSWLSEGVSEIVVFAREGTINTRESWGSLKYFTPEYGRRGRAAFMLCLPYALDP